MKWRVDTERKEAMSKEGYLITWCENSMGMWFNGWGPPNAANKLRKHIEASYDKDKVLAALEAHAAVQDSMKPEEAA